MSNKINKMFIISTVNAGDSPALSLTLRTQIKSLEGNK